MKECQNCGELLGLDCFYYHPTAKFNRRPKCKRCHLLETSQFRRSSLKLQETIRKYRNSEQYRSNFRIYLKKKRRTDEQYRLSCNLRRRLNDALIGKTKSGQTIDDLGCSVKELKSYLESKFKPGMTWGNRNKWHIDHIRPLSDFDLRIREEFAKASHYTNLQPLWPKENLEKGRRLLTKES